MAGIYIHIPFCRKACHYCNFHFSTSLRQKEALLAALEKEFALRLTSSIEVETIYFGGGTPSLLSSKELQLILNQVNRLCKVATDAEITLEANPDDIREETLQQWKNIGFNRLSIGVQTFAKEELEWMNRSHNALQAEQCLDLALKAGFPNISADLIYGSPLLSDEQLHANLDNLISRNIPHISCYGLTIEPKTALAHHVQKGIKDPVQAETQSRQYDILMNRLRLEGYEHYEISNFARQGMRSRHNSSYWSGKPYWGFGPSAHSFDGINTRSWNLSNNALYIQMLERGELPSEKEALSKTAIFNEQVMIQLRTIEGLNLAELLHDQSTDKKEAFEMKVTAVIKKFGDEVIIRGMDSITLSQKGKHFADGIAAALFE